MKEGGIEFHIRGRGFRKTLYRVYVRMPDGTCRTYSRHKTREAAEASLAKWRKARAYFETVKDRLINDN